MRAGTPHRSLHATALVLALASTACETCWKGPVENWCSDPTLCTETVEQATQRMLAKARGYDGHFRVCNVARCDNGNQVIQWHTGYTGQVSYYDQSGKLTGVETSQDNGPPFNFIYGTRLSCGRCKFVDYCSDLVPDGGFSRCRPPVCPP